MTRGPIDRATLTDIAGRMANPQLEKGYTRTANQLEEAIIWAPFNATEYKIVGAIKRLTYGWRRRTVRISQVELAEKCRTTATGGFRKMFESLIREGVIVEVEGPTGRSPGAYALNKNFERWGRYSVPAGGLEATFSDRPNHVDDNPRAVKRIQAATTEERQGDLLDDHRDEDDQQGRGAPSDSDESEPPRLPSQGQSTDENEGRSMPSQGQSTEIRLPSQVSLTALGSNFDRPYKGSHDGANSNGDNAFGPPKDIERHRNTAAVKKGDDGGGIGSTEFESKIVAAALAGVRARWPDKVLSTRHGSDVAAALMTAGVEVEFAVRTIRIALARKLGTAPGSVAWLKDRVLDAHRDAAHEALKHEAGEEPQRRRRSASTAIADIVEPDVRPEYDAARRAAAIAWGKDPKNARDYRAIVEDSNKRFSDMLSTSWGKTGRDQDVLDRCIAAVPFSSFEQWKSERKGGEQSSSPAKTRGRK